jgi:hypothetical protein
MSPPPPRRTAMCMPFFFRQKKWEEGASGTAIWASGKSTEYRPLYIHIATGGRLRSMFPHRNHACLKTANAFLETFLRTYRGFHAVTISS